MLRPPAQRVLKTGDLIEPDRDVVTEEVQPELLPEPQAHNESSGNLTRDRLGEVISGSV